MRYIGFFSLPSLKEKHQVHALRWDSRLWRAKLQRVRDFARFLSRFFEPFVVAVSPTSAKLEPFGASHAEGSSFLCVFSKPLAQSWQRVRFLHVSRTLWAEAFSVDPPGGGRRPVCFFEPFVRLASKILARFLEPYWNDGCFSLCF